MAEIVLGIATSHGPMLTTPPALWGQRVGADKLEENHFYQGNTYSFDQLIALRASENLGLQIQENVWRARHAACQKAISALADVFEEVKPDVAVIIGNDQMEMFTDANVPAFAVYAGETILNQEPERDSSRSQGPGLDVARRGRIPEGGAEYSGQSDLAEYLIKSAMSDGFDLAVLRRFPPHTKTIPHAYGFVFRQIMRDQVIPSVPVFTNTFYPPNQPTVSRCLQFGRSLLKAIESWRSNARVALIASGGLSHFVIDETVDRIVLDAIASGSLSGLEMLPEAYFQSGTSEIKNWIPLMSVMAELEFKGECVDYIPCYRSEAGTGNGMGFAYWHGRGVR